MMLHTTLHVPMTGRTPREPHRAATALELFFDLVFVVALARAASVLHQTIADGGTARGKNGEETLVAMLTGTMMTIRDHPQLGH